jgi:hypothetical protein
MSSSDSVEAASSGVEQEVPAQPDVDSSNIEILTEFDKLSDMSNEAIKRGDPPSAAVMDRILAILDSVDKGGKLSLLFSDVDPLQFDVTFKECKVDDPKLTPVDLRTVSASVKEKLLSRAGDETSIGGVLRFPNKVAVMRSTMGSAFRTNDLIRMLRYYLGIVGFDPFVESKFGRINNNSFDLMVATRCFTLLHAALWDYQQFLPHDVIVELAAGVFSSPWEETAFLKRTTNLAKNMAFAASTTGDRLQWQLTGNVRSTRGFQRIEMSPETSDKVAFSRVRNELVGELKELRVKYPLLDALFRRQLSEEISEDACATASALSFVEAISGFMRTSTKASIDKALADQGEKPKDPPMKNALKRIFKEGLEDIHRVSGDEVNSRDRGIPSFEMWRSMIFNNLTSRSAGGDVVEFSVTYEGEEYLIKARDKTLVWLADPARQMDPMRLRDALDIEPGRLASRDVPARDRRLVFMMPLVYFVYELIIGVGLQRYYAGHPNTTLAKETNSMVANHALGIAASGDPNLGLLLRDFSAFDSTEKWDNVRSHLLSALLEFLSEKNIIGRFGPWRNIGELYTVMWEKLRHAKFEFDGEVVTSDQVNSGEFLTTIINTTTNLANWDVYERNLAAEFPATHRQVKFIHYEVMGDDFQAVFRIAKPDLQAFTDLAVNGERTAESNGLSENAIKTSLRMGYYEYLKKKAIFGWIIPRLPQIQVLGAERTSAGVDPAELLSGYTALLTEYVSRGADPDVTMGLLTYTWNIARRLRTGRRDEDKFETMPFHILYAPRRAGGIGHLAGSLVASTKDSIIFYRNHPIELASIVASMEVVDSSVPDSRAALASQIIKDGTFEKGMAFVEETLNPDRRRASKRSEEWLKSNGLDPESLGIGRYGYENTASRLIHRAVKDNPNLFRVVSAERAKRAAGVARAWAKVRKSSPSSIQKWAVSSRQVGDSLIHLAKWSNYVIFWSGTATETMLDNWRNIGGSTGRMIVELIVAEPMSVFDGIHVVEDDGNEQVTMMISGDMVMTLTEAVAFIGRHPFKMLLAFEWLRSIEIHEGEEVPRAIDVCPVAGLKGYAREVVMRLGVSSEGDSESIDFLKLVTRVLNDNFFPSDIRAEQIFEMVTHPSVIGKTDAVLNVLQFVGASPWAAAKLATSLEALKDRFTFLNKTKTYSTQDMIIGHADLGPQRYREVIDAYSFDAASDAVENLLRGIGMTYFVTGRTSFNRVVVRETRRSDVLRKSLFTVQGEWNPDVTM